MAARRVKMDRLQELVRLHRQGVKTREIARLLGMSPNTERAYRMALLAAGLLDGAEDALPSLSELKAAALANKPGKALPSQQRSQIQGWRPKVEALIAKGLGPREIRRRLKNGEPTFTGSYSQIKRLVRSLERERGVRAEDVAIPVQTAPGEVVQVDFGYVGKLLDPSNKTLRKAWVFVAVLGYSRYTWARIVFDQRIETWVELHIGLIEALGAVPRVFVPDNLKAAVIRAAFTPSDETSLNRSYRELARHYGFRIDPTPPYSPQKKGKVESAVKYLKNGVLKGRDSEDAAEVQKELERFLADEANVRTHGTTRRVPVEEMDKERGEFRPLPAVRYEPILWRHVTVLKDCHVQFDGRLYSVPWRLVGQKVWVRATAESVWIYADDERVATHARREPGPRSTCDAHLPEGRRDLRHRSREHWEVRADALGSEVGELCRGIFDSDDVLYQLRVVQAVIMHLEGFPPHRAKAAARRALFYGVETYGGIKKILAQGLDLEPLPTAVLPVSGELQTARFARDLGDLDLFSGTGATHEPH